MKRFLHSTALLLFTMVPATPSYALSIDINYVDATAWTAKMKTVVEDAVKEWEQIYCPPITIFIDFTWHAFTDKEGNPDNSWGLTQNYDEDPFLHLPISADVELNTRIADQYYWDPTPWDITDDGGPLGIDSLIDAASVLKHEIFHAIGFTDQYSKFAAIKRQDGDLDKDGKNEWYLDYNNDKKFTPGELVLHDDGTNHTDDGYYNNGESQLMGKPGFGKGDQARPSWVEILSLNKVYGYPIHVPEIDVTTGTAALGLLAGILALLCERRRRRYIG